MITPDIEHNLGISSDQSDIRSKEQERREIAQLTEQWVAAGNRIYVASSSEYSTEGKRYNHDDELNPHKKRSSWNSRSIDRKSQAQ